MIAPSPGLGPGEGLSTTTAIAFFSKACFKKSCPSKRGPLTAKNTSPALSVRVSIEYPWARAFPAPSRVPFTAVLISCSVKFMKQLCGYYTVIERMRRCSDCLVCLVTLARDEHGVAFFRFGQRDADGFAPIGLNPVARAFHSFFDFFDDGHRILGPRVVRRDDRK